MAMHLRALGSLLTRRLSPRMQAQAVSPAAVGRLPSPSARTLHTLRDVAFRRRVLGAAAVATSVGLLGFLYLFKSGPTDEELSYLFGTRLESKEVMRLGEIYRFS
ncbi:hypothetical protein ACP4OV_013657 [Aristida adscensionis]